MGIVYGNAQVKRFLAAFTGDIVPDADGTRDIGSAAKRWAELHGDLLDLEGETLNGAELAALKAGGGGAHALLSATHTDVVAASPTRGDIIVANGTPKWEVVALGANGTFLASDGADPGYRTLAAGDIPNISATYSVVAHVHAAGDVTSGTFANARIAQSNVTQHEGAIDHDALSGFVVNEHLDWTQDQGATNIHSGNIPDLSATYSVVAHTHGGVYQPLDSDLTTIAAIAGVNGDILYYDSGWKALVKADNGDVLKLSAGLPTWQAEGGGAAHNFLSATHSDAAAAAAARGAVVVGNATPNWARVTVGSNLDVLATDGTDTTFTALGAAHIQSGTFDAARIPDLSATYMVLVSASPITGNFLVSDVTGQAEESAYSAASFATAGHAHAAYLNKDGSVALTANWDAGSFEIRAETLKSDVAIGTAPFVVTSTTVVANLNADLLDGNEAAAFAAAGHDHSGVYQPLNAYLTDIAAVSPALGSLLVFNGSDWVNLGVGTDGQVLISTGSPVDVSWGSVPSHVHAASDVTSGTFANARIAQSNVTQHVAAIDHDSLLNFVANEHLDWTQDQGATNIHSGNIPDLSATYSVVAHTHAVYLNKDGSVALTANWDAGAYEIRALTFESDVVTGTAPFAVASQTVVANLNVSLLEGNAAAAFATAGHNHSGVYEPVDATILREADVDDTPVNGATVAPVSSNWAYDHENAANPHPGYLTPAEGDAAYQPLNAYLTDIAAITPSLGDLIIYDGSDFVRLALGNESEALVVSGSPLSVEWVDISAVYQPLIKNGTSDFGTGDLTQNVDLGLRTDANDQSLQANFAGSVYALRPQEHIIMLPILGELTNDDESLWVPLKFPGDTTRVFEIVRVYAYYMTTDGTTASTVKIQECTQTDIDGAPSWTEMLTTHITIDANEKSSNTAATPAVIDGTKSMVDGDHLKAIVTAVGTSGEDLIVVVTVREKKVN